MKRSARITAAIVTPLVALLLLLAVAPMLFRGRIEQAAQREVNQSVDARVAWQGLGLSFFRHFPNLSLTLDGLTVAGAGRFDGDTLAAVQHLRVVLDLGSVVGHLAAGRPLVVRALEIEQPRLHLLVLPDGTANWTITRPSPAAAPAPNAAPFAVRLRNVTIHGAAVVFDDRHANVRAAIAGYDQSLSGDLSQRRVVIHTTASADTATVIFAGVPYLDRVALGLATDIDADLAGHAYTLAKTELRANGLTLGVAGTVKAVGTALGIDLQMKSPATDFRSILSLVPAVYAHDFDKLQTSGTVAVDGWVKGTLGDSAFPAFALDTKVNDASFKYADLPLPARSIFVHLALTNGGGGADSTVVTLDRFHVVLGSNPIDAHLVLRTPVSDPDVDAGVTGTLDLADLRRTVKLQGVDQLAGTVAANAAVHTRMSYLARQAYDKVAASGTVNVSGVTVTGSALPQPLAIAHASLALAPQHAKLGSFAGTLGTSDLQASGTLDNLVGFALHGDTLRGAATLRSTRVNLNEWRSGGSMDVILVPPRIDVALDATVARLLYGTLAMTDARARLRVAGQRATLEQFRANALGGQVAVSGTYETTRPDTPTFDVNVTLTKVDVPSAFQAFTTVQMLAPVAKYASGSVTTDVHLAGAFGKDMMPVFPTLSGAGTLETSALALRGFPVLTTAAAVTKIDALANPTLQPLHAAFRIDHGRLTVQPFTATVAGITANVAGSNGLDQTLQYAVGLRVPRSMLGSAANQTMAGLASRAGQAGVNLAAAPEIPLAIRVGGTVTSPTVDVDVASVASSAKAAVQQAVTKRASAAATQLVQDAEQRAAVIKQQAQTLADSLKQSAYRQADSLTAKAGSNPLLQVAAKAAADKLRAQADDKSAAIVRAANQRADSLLASARAQANKIDSTP